ncbi:MAG: aldo/keto reductase [Bacillaceae bacterium]
MNYRQLGQSDLHVSEIGLGTMTIGTDYNKGISIIHAALDNGINFVDTADLYDFGLNEEIVGSAIKSKRNDLIIGTKGGNDWSNQTDGWRWNPSKTYIKEAVKNSLRRLQIEYIDLYQLHGGTIEDNIDETIDAFEELVSEGVIRYYGISSIRPNVIAQYIAKSNIVSIMMPYNILDRRAEEFFDLLYKKNISVLTRGTLAKGLLTDAYSSKLTKDYLSYSLEELHQLLPHLLASEKNISLTSLALQFNLQHPVVASAIVGASSVTQLENTIKCYQRHVNDEIIKNINKHTKKEIFTHHR